MEISYTDTGVDVYLEHDDILCHKDRVFSPITHLLARYLFWLKGVVFSNRFIIKYFSVAKATDVKYLYYVLYCHIAYSFS